MARKAGKRGRTEGYAIRHVNSPAGQAQLAKRGLTARDLARAAARFQTDEKVRIGTPIGVSEDGFFGSTEDGWTPNRPGAFDEPLVTIPWVQILELLGRVPENTTGEFLDGGGKLQ